MEKVRIEKRLLLSFNAVFKNEGIDPQTLLKSIPQKLGVEFVSYLLHLYNLRKKDDHQFHADHLIKWMMQTDHLTKLSVSKFIEIEKDIVFGSSFNLIDRRPCLDLIQYLLVYADRFSNQQSLSSNHYSILLKCLLYFNSIEIEAQEKLFNSNDNCSLEEFANHILIVKVRNIEHERFKDYKLEFLKVYYFFIFCESHDKYSNHLNTFLASLGLTSYKSYLWNLMSPYLKIMINEEPTPKINIGGTSLNFYQRLVINDQIIIPDKDYKPLRQFPLYNSDPNLYVLMDVRFFIDKFYQSFLFDFATVTKIPYSTLKTDMGNEFSEHILFYTIMDKCFGNYGDIRLRGDDIKAKLRSGEPDFYIRNSSKVFLFEFKDIGLTAEIKYSGNAEKIKTSILEKLEKSTTGKQKGITQLLNIIKEIKAGKYNTAGLDVLTAEETEIYPIIVYTDITFESAGVNYFLNKRFEILITESELFPYRIKPLILINLDTLILLQEHFLNGKLDLGKCIDSYIEYISVTDAQTATFPFDEFIKYYFVKENNEKIGYPKDFDSIVATFSNS